MTKIKVRPEAHSVTASTKPLKPSSIQIVGPMNLALNQLCAHVRNGYTLDDSHPIDVLGPNISFALVLGSPSQDAREAAEAALADALIIEEVSRLKDIEAAAQRLFEDRLRAERTGKLAIEIAAQEQALSKLKASLKAI